MSAAQEQVTAEEEKRIIGLFAQEGSAFVPNILPEVVALEHIGLAQEKVSTHGLLPLFLRGNERRNLQ